MTRSSRKLLVVFVALAVYFLVIRPHAEDPGEFYEADAPGDGPYPVQTPEQPGAAVALLIDTSGSMADPAPGDDRPKSVVAREALTRILEVTDAFVAQHPNLALRFSLIEFSSAPEVVMPSSPYQRQALEGALKRVSSPDGATALGAALSKARAELYRSGCTRKYILAITDGENTTGPSPEVVAPILHRRSEGAIRIFFVAFDTDPHKFGFLREVGGDVVGAQSATELAEVLKSVYEGRILVEALEGS